MTIMKKLYFFVIGFFLITSINYLQAQPFDSTLASKLQIRLDNLTGFYNLKGISASVLYPGEGMWQGVSGISRIGVPVTPDMEFGIASNTKLFTAVALLKLQENNIIDLDDSLYKWIPKFNNVDSNITIRQILNHTSGIADVTSIPGYRDSILLNPYRIFTPYEIVSWIGPRLFPAGTGWSYSNTNYLIAGMVFERAAGRKIASFIRDSILTPLSLDSTFFDVEEAVGGTIANPWHQGVDFGMFPRTGLNSAAWTAGAMYSNSGDMARWYQGLLEGGFLRNDSFEEMTTFTGTGNYGLAIAEDIFSGRTVWGHGGDIIGYRSRVIYDTTLHVVVCVLTNTNPAPVSEMAEALLNTIVNNPVSGTGAGVAKDLPGTIELYGNYPNPFNPSTKIEFSLPERERVALRVFNVMGEEVAKVAEGIMEEGRHGFVFDAKGLSSGVYFYRLETGRSIISRKMLILK